MLPSLEEQWMTLLIGNVTTDTERFRLLPSLILLPVSETVTHTLLIGNVTTENERFKLLPSFILRSAINIITQACFFTWGT